MRVVSNEGQAPKIAIQEERQFRKEKFVGSMVLKKGQSCFGYDMTKNIVYQAKYEEEAPVLSDINHKNPQNMRVKRKVKWQDGHLYCVALNMKNAEKKFERVLRRALTQK